MPHTKKKGGTPPDPEKIAKIRKAYQEYNDPNTVPERRPTQEQLEKKYGIPQGTLSFYFKKWDRETLEPEEMRVLTDQPTSRSRDRRAPPPGGDRASLVAERKTTSEAIKSLSERSADAYNIAINIGNHVVDNYADLVKLALAKGMKLQDFITDVFNWYERREEVEKQLRDQEHALAELQELTLPNYIFRLKSELLVDFTARLATEKRLGLRINIKEAARALQNDLNKIDEQINPKK